MCPAFYSVAGNLNYIASSLWRKDFPNWAIAPPPLLSCWEPFFFLTGEAVKAEVRFDRSANVSSFLLWPLWESRVKPLCSSKHSHFMSVGASWLLTVHFVEKEENHLISTAYPPPQSPASKLSHLSLADLLWLQLRLNCLWDQKSLIFICKIGTTHSSQLLTAVSGKHLFSEGTGGKHWRAVIFSLGVRMESRAGEENLVGCGNRYTMIWEPPLVGCLTLTNDPWLPSIIEEKSMPG